MKKEQRVVAIGAISGVVGMMVLVWALYTFLPHMAGANSIAFIFKMNVIAVLPLLMMIAVVGNARFLSDAIDPTKHAESATLEIDGRVLDNTLQQTVLFVVGTTGLGTVLPLGMGNLFAALAIVFVLARIIFWAGYRKHPLLRAPGMAATSYMNLGIILATLYFIFI